MNVSLISLEILVVALGVAILLADLWAPPAWRRAWGYLAALGLLGVLTWSAVASPVAEGSAFGGMVVVDGLSLFFKRFFLVTGTLVMVLAAAGRADLGSGIAEYYALSLFSLAGMMLAASVGHFAALFVALELITVPFYVLTAFQRHRARSLEAGAKYLVLGALSSAILIYGIALVYGATGTMAFDKLASLGTDAAGQPLLAVGLLMVLAGLCFKIAAVPFQFWAPDVYQGAPLPTMALLAVGSKAAGFALLLRLASHALPTLAPHAQKLLLILAGATILYGNLCAVRQPNFKRMIGYAGIASAGYLLMGFAAMTRAGTTAILFYLGSYLFTLLAILTVFAVVARTAGIEETSSLAGLGQRSPLMAAGLTLGMVSLAGVPPLAGFFGKFLLIKAVLERGAADTAFYWIAGVAVVGVVISIYYCFAVVRTVYWPAEAGDLSPLRSDLTSGLVVVVCSAVVLALGVFPAPLLDWITRSLRTWNLG
jgi:NADH-quinone oxidoreductase subunit N